MRIIGTNVNVMDGRGVIVASGERERIGAALAGESVAAQKAIEAADTLPFEEWRQHYMAAQGLGI